MANPLIIIARARAKPGLEQQMIAAQIELVATTRLAAGCLNYELHVSNHEPGMVTFFERWESAAAWHAHMQSEALHRFRQTAGHCIGEFELDEMHQVA